MSEASTPSLRLLALAAFAGDAAPNPRRIPVDKERFDAAMAAVAPRLALAVPDRSGAGPDPLPVTLAFARLADFAPAAVVERVPALVRLREARAAVEAAARGELDRAGLESRLQHLPPAWRTLPEEEAGTASPVPTPGTGETRPASGAADTILDLVDTGQERSVHGTAKRLVDQLTPGRPRAAAAARPELDALQARIDRALAAQLDEILGSAPFRSLEGAWRGLKLLVDRTDFREPIELELIACSADGAPAAIDALFEGEDVDLILADYAFDASARDLARVEALAEAAARAQTPVVTGVAPAFVGLDSWRGLARARDPGALFAEESYADWRSLRERDESRWLVLVANRIALRAAYGPEGESPRELAYVQEAGGGLLGGGPWAIGVAIARSFARSHACVQFTGAQHGLVTDLALLPLGPDGRPAPVEGVFSDERREDLERIGLAVVQLYQRDSVFVGAVRSFRKPPRYPDPEATADAAQQVTLAYQLYASRLVKLLGRVVPELTGLADAEAVKRQLREQVLRVVSTPEKPLRADHVGIEVRDDPDDGSLVDVALRILPEVTIAGRPANFLMQFSMRR